VKDSTRRNILSKGPIHYRGVGIVREVVIGFLQGDQSYFITVEAVVGETVISSNTLRTGTSLNSQVMLLNSKS
jgi:hypothetical protein